MNLVVRMKVTDFVGRRMLKLGSVFVNNAVNAPYVKSGIHSLGEEIIESGPLIGSFRVQNSSV